MWIVLGKRGIIKLIYGFLHHFLLRNLTILSYIAIPCKSRCLSNNDILELNFLKTRIDATVIGRPTFDIFLLSSVVEHPLQKWKVRG